MKKTVSVFISAIIVFCSVSISANAVDSAKADSKNCITEICDFCSLYTDYIIYYPDDLTKNERTYPVAVWANGTMCPPFLYKKILKGVAQSGYIVIASHDMMPKDGKSQRAAIDYIFNENEDSNSIFYNKIDKNHVGAFGHSQGGASSVNAACADSRIGAVVSIAGASTAKEASGLRVPSLFLTGRFDFIVLSSMWVKPSYSVCNAPAAYASLKYGIHTSCILNADIYIDCTVKWFDAWFYNEKNISFFQSDGEITRNSKITNYSAKNLDNR